MKLELEVNFGDGSKQSITAKASDFVAFEERFDLSISTLGDKTKMTHLFFLAWHAQKREGATELDFEAWLDTIEMVSPQTPKK